MDDKVEVHHPASPVFDIIIPYSRELWQALNLVKWLSDGIGEINFKLGNLYA